MCNPPFIAINTPATTVRPGTAPPAIPKIAESILRTRVIVSRLSFKNLRLADTAVFIHSHAFFAPSDILSHALATKFLACPIFSLAAMTTLFLIFLNAAFPLSHTSPIQDSSIL